MKDPKQTKRIFAGLLLASVLMSVPVSAVPAVVDESLTSIRTETTSEPISAEDATAESNSPVDVTTSDVSGSIEILYQDEVGTETTITVDAKDSEEETVYALVCTYGDVLRVRQGPGTDCDILGTVPDLSYFPITGEVDGWYQIIWNGETGYVSGVYIEEKSLDEVLAFLETATVTAEEMGQTDDSTLDVVAVKAPESDTPRPTGAVAVPADYDENLGQAIVDYALTYVGYSYVYGTAGPDTFDCSGFTSWVYNHFGYTLNRCSKDQLGNGKPVAKADLLPGDIVLFSRNGRVVTHVGLYIGDGEIVHASTSTTGVIISDLYSDYYVRHYYAARRII